MQAWVTKQYSMMKSARVNFERQWYLNMAFFLGRQNVVMVNTASTTTGFRLNTPPAPPWRVRMVINKIRPITRKLISTVCSNRPSFDVMPSTNDDEGYNAARVAQSIFDSLYDSKNIDRVTRDMMWWDIITGTAYMKAYWDAQAVDVASNQKGDIKVEAVTPFHLFVPDLRETDLENQSYVLHATTKSVNWVQANFQGLLKDGQLQANVKAANDLLLDTFLGINGGSNSNVDDQVLCLEMWIKPGGHPKFPNGGLITIVADKVVGLYEKYPYQHGMYPFARFTNIHAGKHYGESVITDLLPVQREYNRTRSQIIEAKNRMAKPQLIAAKGSVNANQITTEPGQVILYIPGFDKPQPLPLTPLPSYVLQEVEQLQNDFDELSGVNDAMRGDGAQGVHTAAALQFLQEQGQSILDDTISSLEAGIEKIGKLCLGYVDQYWTTERTVKVAGTDESYDVQVFKNTSMQHQTDLRVQAGSALPQSKAAKASVVMDLMKMGLIPAQDGLKALDMGSVDKLYEQYLAGQRQAQRENLKLANGQPLTQPSPQQVIAKMLGQEPDPNNPETADTSNSPNTWDNDALHIQIHNTYRMSNTFELLPANIKQAFEEHVNLHTSAMASKAIQQAQQQQAVQETVQQSAPQPPGGGAPGPQQGEPQQMQQGESPPQQQMPQSQ